MVVLPVVVVGQIKVAALFMVVAVAAQIVAPTEPQYSVVAEAWQITPVSHQPVHSQAAAAAVRKLEPPELAGMANVIFGGSSNESAHH